MTTSFKRLLPRLLLLTLPAAAQAQFIYTTNNGAITIIQYTGSGGAVTIPGATNGLLVTSIGYEAFLGSGLTSVTIPDTVTSIGDSAFENCYSLASVAIPDSVTSIGELAFNECTSLSGVTIGNSVTIIGVEAFFYCTSLDGVTIGNSVTNIGDSAFQNCLSLSGVYFQGNAPAADSSVFSGDTNATVYYLPGTTNWGSTFAGVPAVAWYPPVPYTFTTNNGAITITGYTGSNSVVTVPGTITGLPVTSIGEYAFFDCTNLSSVTIPDGVTSIGASAFSWCTSLTSVTLPNSVTSLGDSAFDSCTGLTGLYSQGNAPSLGFYVFFNASKATVYWLPGATGWGTTFGGRPTALWQPQVQTRDGSFGVRTNQFGFNINWATGVVVVVEACTNLAPPLWSPVQTNTLTATSFYFSDPQWTNYPARFYRLRSP